jgi:cytidine deaminase
VPEERENLIGAAMRAREAAYAPYSCYRVGAALRDERGSVHAGCNVENLSYGATICAERAAVTAMVAAGGREVRELALVTQDGNAPCGICLQVLAEFTPDPASVAIHCAGTGGAARTFKLSELLPVRFDSREVPRTP